MKKFYRIFILLVALLFLTTFNPKELNHTVKKNDDFFKIKSVEIRNNLLIKETEIIQKLGNVYKKNIFLLKKQDIEEPLRDINFFEKIEVKKKYPDKIVIKIFETVPLAILFKNKTKYFLDSSSNLIFFDKEIYNEQLPSIFGEGAEKKFIYFFNKLKENNFPHDKIRNFYYFKIGRWDIELAEKKVIKFPSSNENKAINKSIELLHDEDFEKYSMIDLRVDGKIVVE